MEDEMLTTDEQQITQILDGIISWPQSLRVMTSYKRTHDDCEGERGQCIEVMFGPDGDAHCKQGITELELQNIDRKNFRADILFPAEMIRFRNWFGGGRSLRVYNALVILALAIWLDNKDDPLGNPDFDAPEH